MKEILIDLYKVKNRYSGLGQFSENFAREYARSPLYGVTTDYLVPDKKLPINSPGIRLVKAGFQKRYFPSFNKNYDLWHSLHQFPSHQPNQQTRFLLTIHDLNFLVEKGGAKRKKYLDCLQRNIHKADAITTISEYTRNLVQEHVNLRGKKIQVIYNGITTGDPAESPPGYVQGKFFFSIGLFNRKKNFHSLLPAMKHFKDHQLILAGDHATAYGREMKVQIDQMDLGNQVVLAGKVSDPEKYWLYSNCEAFLFPSLAEGFGMPAIEAMKFGKPVFLSTFSSLPEIGDDKAFYFDKLEEDAMAGFIKEKLAAFHQDPVTFSKEVKAYAEKFNWEKCLGEYKQLYREILDS